MKDYGGDTQKPTWLYSNYNILDSLAAHRTGPGERFGTQRLTRTYTDKNGKKAFIGNKHLKESQHYPVEFGKAVRKMYLKHEKTIRMKMRSIRVKSLATRNRMSARDDWEDAVLDDVVAALVP